MGSLNTASDMSLHSLLTELSKKKHARYLHETSFNYYPTLDNMQNTRTVTLDYGVFELWPFEYENS